MIDISLIRKDTNISTSQIKINSNYFDEKNGLNATM
jgi:hypothetical protein